ncbi:MAG: YajD family HNH nuclease [Thermodesulfobacteriota bacterium]
MRFKPRRRTAGGARGADPATGKSYDEIFAEAKREQLARSQDYRARSLALHGWICARCAREFEAAELHLLTVHHKDGNHDNNPPDGSNWENLCVYCHEAEHSTGLLGDYLTGRDRKP